MKNTNILAPFLLIVGVGAVLLYGTLTTGHDWGDDFAAYIMQARSLTEAAPAEFLEANRFTAELSSHVSWPLAYPWGFPLLLAPFYKVFGLNMIALKTVGVLFYLLFLGLLWFGFRKVHSPIWFLSLVCLFALNPTLLAFSDNILSDLPFLFLSTLVLVLTGTMVIERRRCISQLWDSVLIGVLIAAAFFVRTNGFLLLVSLGFAQLICHFQKQSHGRQQDAKNERSLLTHLVPYAVFFGAVAIWESMLPQGGMSHLTHFSGLSLGMVKRQLLYYLVLPADFFAGVPQRHLFYWASIPLAIVGMTRRYRSEYHVLVYMVLTLALYLVWPAQEGLRFLFPVLPFYLSFVLSGLEAVQAGATAAERKFWKWACLIPVSLVVLSFGLVSARGAYLNTRRNREMPSGAFTITARGLFSFIRDHTEEESTVVFFKPRLMRLVTNRKSVLIDRVKKLARGDYLCLSRRGAGEHSQVSAVEAEDLREKGMARLIYENSDFQVFRLVAGGPGEPPGRFTTTGRLNLPLVNRF